MKEVLEFINAVVREEKGNRVTVDSLLIDADLDSFGITVLFLELDGEYEYFSDVPDDVDTFSTIDFPTITIKEIVDKCLLHTTST